MKTELADCSFLVRKWRANRIELMKFAAMSSFDRERHAARQARLESEQNNIEYILGVERPGDFAWDSEPICS